MIPTCVRIVLILSGGDEGNATNEFKSKVFAHPVQLRWGECDPAGIIFYPTYFLWFDAAAWNMFAQVGYHAKRMRAEHLAMPLVAAGCEFKHPAEQEDRAEVRSRIARWGGKSFVARARRGARATASCSRRAPRRASGAATRTAPERRSRASRSARN